MKQSKVFCKLCEYLGCSWSDGYGCGEGTYHCNSPSNKKDTWFGQNRRYANTPQELNKDNSCPFFKRAEKGGD